MLESLDLARSTPAASADILGDDATLEVPVNTPDGASARPSPQAPADRSVRRESVGAPESGDARPGEDINQAGFIKDAAPES